MDANALAFKLEELRHEVDMLVFRLEREGPADPQALAAERKRTRRELERVRDDLANLLRQL